MIPKAVATGRCEIRPNSYVRKIETDAKGRATGVKYFDADKKEVFQRAKAVVVCANGAETPRLLLNSKLEPVPARARPTRAASSASISCSTAPGSRAGVFEHEVNGYKGIVATRVVWDLYELDPKLGLGRRRWIRLPIRLTPIQFAMNDGLPPKAPRWGKEYKRWVAHNYTRTVLCFGHTTSLPVETNSISLDPTVKDAWGVPAIRMTYRIIRRISSSTSTSPSAAKSCCMRRARRRRGSTPVESQEFAVHLLGTCRMGNDPKTSVVDKYNRAHDVKNLFIVDGSSLVTSGRGQPTMTIQALAFRAGDNIARFAKRREI